MTVPEVIELSTIPPRMTQEWHQKEKSVLMLKNHQMGDPAQIVIGLDGRPFLFLALGPNYFRTNNARIFQVILMMIFILNMRKIWKSHIPAQRPLMMKCLFSADLINVVR